MNMFSRSTMTCEALMEQCWSASVVLLSALKVCSQLLQLSSLSLSAFTQCNCLMLQIILKKVRKHVVRPQE